MFLCVLGDGSTPASEMVRSLLGKVCEERLSVVTGERSFCRRKGDIEILRISYSYGSFMTGSSEL